MTAHEGCDERAGNAGADSTAREYLKLADEAVLRGDLPQSAHLYLAAFDAAQSKGTPGADYVDGLRKAWKTAVELKDASLAEHVYGLLEPYSTAQDEADHTHHLQSMAQSALEGFGMPTDEAQGMAEMLTGDTADATQLMQLAGKKHAADRDSEEDDEEAEEAEEQSGYADLVGFERAIEAMRRRGVGMADDGEFNEFLAMMRLRHGIEDAARTGSLLISADSPDDANIFMLATGAELGFPAIRMRVEENAIGLPTLSIMMSKGMHNGQKLITNGFSGPGVLMLENIDEWGVPDFSAPDGAPLPLYLQLTRGALQVVSFIRNAVEDPQVQVMASSGPDAQLDAFFADLLFPLEHFEIKPPTREERGSLWNYASTLHPSLGMLDREELVALTQGMSRTDIYSAGRQAVEEAWREGIRNRRYVPVTRANVLEKIALYQSLGSEEYREVEEALAENLGREFDDLESAVDRWREDAGL